MADKILKTVRMGQLQITVFEKKCKDKTYKNIVLSKYFKTGKKWNKYRIYMNSKESEVLIFMLQNVEDFLTKETEKKIKEV